MAFGKQDTTQEPGQPQVGGQPGVISPINPFGGGNADPNLQGMGRDGFEAMKGTGVDTSQYAQAGANDYRRMMGYDPINSVGAAVQTGRNLIDPGSSGTGGGGEYDDAVTRTMEANARLNRPNTQTPFASSQWTQAPDGTWQLTQGFSGPLAGLAGGLQEQAAGMGGPMDWAQFGTLGTGDSARQQAIDAAYGQSTSRLNPMFGQRENALRSRLLNQGVPEGSKAFNDAMDNFGRERTDAYQGALNAAIGQGTQAGQAVFNQNLLGRQQAISEALRRRGQPLQELQQLQGLLRQPVTNQLSSPDFLAALTGQQGADADKIAGIAQLIAAASQFIPKNGP